MKLLGILTSLMLVGVSQAAAPLICRTVDTPPILDGRLDDAAWKNAKTIQDGPVTLRGVVCRGALYLAATCQEQAWPEASKTLKPTDDVNLTKGAHLDIGISDLDWTTSCRAHVTPEGAVYDYQQKKNVGGKWAHELAWRSDAKTSKNLVGRSWTVEMTCPLTQGFAWASRMEPGETPHDPVQHAIEVEHQTEPGTGAVPAPLSVSLDTLSDQELVKMAEQQSSEASAAETALKVLKAQDEAYAILLDDTTSDEDAKTRLLDAGAKDPELYQDVNKKEMEAQLDHAIAMRSAIKGLAPQLKRHSQFEQTLYSSASLPAFLHAMREQGGDKAFKGLPNPGGRPPFGATTIPVGPSPKGLPKEWGALTEEQFQQSRRFLLRHYTRAGGEVVKRGLSKLMGGSDGDDTETTAPSK